MNPLFNPLTGLATAGLLTLAGALTDGSSSKALTLAGAGAAGGSAVAALVGAKAVRRKSRGTCHANAWGAELPRRRDWSGTVLLQPESLG